MSKETPTVSRIGQIDRCRLQELLLLPSRLLRCYKQIVAGFRLTPAT